MQAPQARLECYVEQDCIRCLGLGPEGEIYLVGNTSSDDFPVTDGAVQKRHGGKGDAFVVKLLPGFP